ncbi:methyltransferase [Nodularia sp. NIES-3585]|uniref:methyltransferase n=1 Tax=Nodularia sp. NIES-3585 TaxID=1973477 RepID=UPI000B5C3C7E|nr:methyltransferase [Nodularia sp. NIES-3585]GAX36366.1 release factor glutamine methyltransferase [Nodularia sp. NIES-3585]
MDKLELATLGRGYIDQTPYGIFEFRGHEVIVLPTVLIETNNTGFFSELIEELAHKVLQSQNQCRVFEMGMGTGAAILTVAKIKGVVASASDISPMAALNAKANALWWGVECDIYQGNLFENVPEGKFEIISWNIPYFKENPGGIEDVKFRSGFDPDYQYLTQFLADCQSRLAENGHLMLGVDYLMCDLDTIYQLIDQAGFKSQVWREMNMTWGVMDVVCAFLLLERK